MATLKDLLSVEELNQIGIKPDLINAGEITGNTDVRFLTVQHLSDMALILLDNEMKKTGLTKVPECFLPAKALEILFQRALDKNIGIL